MDFEYYLTEQFHLHPSMQPQDVAKLCYQAAYGAEHLLFHLDRAKAYFQQEFETVPANELLPLYEPISQNVCRVHLAAWKARKLPPEQLFELFTASATVAPDGDTLFSEYLTAAEQQIQQNRAAFSFAEWQAFFKVYRKAGMPVVHHSEAFRQAEQPAYRIVKSGLLKERGL